MTVIIQRFVLNLPKYEMTHTKNGLFAHCWNEICIIINGKNYSISIDANATHLDFIITIIINDSNQTLNIIILNCILKSKMFQTNWMRNQHFAHTNSVRHTVWDTDRIGDETESPSLYNRIHSFIYIYCLIEHHGSGLIWWRRRRRRMFASKIEAPNAFAVIELSLLHFLSFSLIIFLYAISFTLKLYLCFLRWNTFSNQSY